jgi:general secretion pathway protein D
MRVPTRHRWTTGGAATLAVLLLAGCGSGSLDRARNADELHDYDVAVAEYTKALREHPDSQTTRLGLETAKLRAADAHFLRGQRLAAQGRTDDAIVELQIATDLNPSNANADRALKDARTAQRERLTKEAAGNPTALEQLLARQPALAVPGYSLPDGPYGQQIQTAPNTTAREVYLTIGQLANISVTFDPTFQDRPAQVSLLANTMSIRQVLSAVGRASNTFYQVTGPNAIIVVPNTPAKLIEYQQQVVQTFYVQNVDPKDVADFLRTVADARFEGISAPANALSIRDTPERLAMIGRIIAAIDKARPEVVVDVEILEVDRTRLAEYGLQLASAGSAGPNGTISVQNDPSPLAALQALSPSNVIASSIPALYYRLLKTDQNTRTLANPHVRMTDGVKGVAEFGTSVPVPNTTFSPVQQGGLNEQAVTSFEYKNIGVSISITSHTHPNDDVTLALDVLLNNIAGSGFQGLPTFGNRHVSTTLRLKDGETNILAGLIRNDETVERDGIPGLSSVPGLRDVFSKTHKERDESDVVVMLTPHIVHGLAVTEEDLRPLMVPRDGITGTELPPPGAPGAGRGGGGGSPELSAKPNAQPALPVTAGWPTGLSSIPISALPKPAALAGIRR